MKGSKMPNSGSGKAKAGSKNTGASTGLRKETSQRSDVTKAPSNKNHFPNGLS